MKETGNAVSGNTSAILRRVRETLRTAQEGLAQMQSEDPRRRSTGLRNVAVFGRAVTNVLQGLRSVEGEFDSWYQPKVDEMREDPLLRYFYELRTEILKRGDDRTEAHTHIKSLSRPDLAELDRPPNATSFFMGDQLGGNGWEIELPDGSTEKYYVDVPDEIGETWQEFQDPPDRHFGETLDDASVVQLSEKYVAYLEELVEEADEEFGR